MVARARYHILGLTLSIPGLVTSLIQQLLQTFNLEGDFTEGSGSGAEVVIRLVPKLLSAAS